MVHSKKILVVPLDWGLGHATRCIPIIQELIEQGHQVIIGGNNKTNTILKSEFPNLKFENLQGYDIRYSQNPSFLPLKILIQLPKIVIRVMKERKWLNALIARQHIDAVISDNRYGLHNKTITSIIVTHQLCILVPQSFWLQHLVNRLNYHYLKKFNSCWIPDDPEIHVSGKLTALTTFTHHKFIGLLSRFQKPKTVTEFVYDILFILSGPEPQRSILEEKIISEFAIHKGRKIIIRGKPLQGNSASLSGFEVYSHCTTTELQAFILQSRYVVSRAGYSSIMDYITLGKAALLIPTPGQTEQEYLAKYLSEKKMFATCNQADYLPDFLAEIDRCYLPQRSGDDTNLLQLAIAEVV